MNIGHLFQQLLGAVQRFGQNSVYNIQHPTNVVNTANRATGGYGPALPPPIVHRPLQPATPIAHSPALQLGSAPTQFQGGANPQQATGYGGLSSIFNPQQRAVPTLQNSLFGQGNMSGNETPLPITGGDYTPTFNTPRQNLRVQPLQNMYQNIFRGR